MVSVICCVDTVVQHSETVRSAEGETERRLVSQLSHCKMAVRILVLVAYPENPGPRRPHPPLTCRSLSDQSDHHSQQQHALRHGATGRHLHWF